MEAGALRDGHVPLKKGAVAALGAVIRQMVMVSFADLKDAAFDADLDQLLYASDLLNRVPVPLRAGDDLTTALHLMNAGVVDRMTVVADDDSSRAIGISHRAEILKAQGEALKAAWRANQGGA